MKYIMYNQLSAYQLLKCDKFVRSIQELFIQTLQVVSSSNLYGS